MKFPLVPTLITTVPSISSCLLGVILEYSSLYDWYLPHDIDNCIEFIFPQKMPFRISMSSTLSIEIDMRHFADDRLDRMKYFISDIFWNMNNIESSVFCFLLFFFFSPFYGPRTSIYKHQRQVRELYHLHLQPKNMSSVNVYIPICIQTAPRETRTLIYM